jgi:ABC-type spermidine/putrescine transport system permease subunit I
MPLWVLGLIAIALLTGTLRGGRLPRFGREVMVGSLVLLVLPFLTLPVGASVARVIKITSENPSITLFFRSISTSLTVSVVAVLMAFPVAYYLAFCRGKSKYTWLVILIAPFLTSYLLRVLAFKVILTDNGSARDLFRVAPVGIVIRNAYDSLSALTPAEVIRLAHDESPRNLPDLVEAMKTIAATAFTRPARKWN